MEWRYQYESDTEREKLINEHNTLYLIREENITEGNFLTFSDEALSAPAVYVSVPKEDFDSLKQDSTLLKAQSKALAERAAFTDDVIAEIAMKVYE